MNKLLLVLCALFMMACSATRITENESLEMRKDSIADISYIFQQLHDTTIIKELVTDSVVMYVKGDTVFKEKYRNINTSRERYVTNNDTSRSQNVKYIINTKYIRQYVEKQKEFTMWDRFRLRCGEASLLVWLVGIILFTIYYVRK